LRFDYTANNNQETRFWSRVRAVLLEIGGWLIPLVGSMPSLFIWAGLMTMPLMVYLGIMFLSLFEPSVHFHSQESGIPYFLPAVDVLLLGGPYLPDKVISIFGVLLMVYATVYLNMKRKKGLVTTGPYRMVRNPQYLGAILFIINLTSRSYREVLGDVGWLGPVGTIRVWLGTIGAYLILALVEEQHLVSVFGESYKAYRRKTPFLFPFIAARPRVQEILVSILIPVLFLWALVGLNRVWYP